jgi:hypothetical protein
MIILLFTSPVPLHCNSSLVTNIRLELKVIRSNYSRKICYIFRSVNNFVVNKKENLKLFLFGA